MKSRKSKKLIKRIMIGMTTTAALGISCVLTFFHTNIFASQRDLWVQTAMSTSSHKWLATAFMSDDAIDKILTKYTVVNTKNSDSDSVQIKQTSTKTTTSSSEDTELATDSTTIKEISGSTYKGYVVSIRDPSKVSLSTNLDSNNQGQLVSETLATDSSYQAIINAGGFNFSPHSGESASSLNSATIVDGELIYGDASQEVHWIGMSEEGKLILGIYTYEEALDAGINDGVDFGPYLLIDGEEQVKNEETGGLQPRTAIGQSADGTIFMVVIEGRNTESAGATLYDLQEIMEDLGAVNAANLDGGGSSELFYDGELKNVLSNSSERAMTTVFTVSK